MSISNKTNIIILVLLITLTGLGCGLFNSESSKQGGTANVDNTGSTANSAEESSNTNTNTTQKSTGGTSQTSVQFDKGKTSKSYKNTISKGNRQTYTLNAAAGQELSVKIISTSGKAVFEVFDPSGTDMMGYSMLELIDEPLKQSGNHKVVVTSEAASSEYSIQFDIKGGATSPGTTPVPSSATKTVKFNKGSSSASYSNNLSSGSNHKYILGASAGQTMTVSVSGGAEFGIYAPDGTTVVKVTKSYSGPLPANGNYEIEVFGSPGPYTINFSVR
jgi:hypothetical protein